MSMSLMVTSASQDTQNVKVCKLTLRMQAAWQMGSNFGFYQLWGLYNRRAQFPTPRKEAWRVTF